jgi:thiamine-phosphate pyrophosphorylase
MSSNALKFIAVTNRHLAGPNFLGQIEKVAAAGIDALVLREKDMDTASYKELSAQVLAICRCYDIPCVFHHFAPIAAGKTDKFQCSLADLRNDPSLAQRFPLLGISIHSPEEAQEAQRRGATYLVAGHVFVTTCKPGLPPRGLPFLRQVCTAANLPVYAIGGITPRTLSSLGNIPLQGVCIMSGFMICRDPQQYLQQLRRAL